MGRCKAKFLVLLAEMTVMLCTLYPKQKRVEVENRARYGKTCVLLRFSSF